MKIKKALATQPEKRKMTDAEIKEAVERDKEWMNRIDPDEEIRVPKGMLKDIFDDLKRKLDDEEADDAGADDVEELEPEDSDGEIDDGNELITGGDDGVDGGKMVGALIGGIGGLVVGSILGAAILGDD